jgi:hypothetical protein
VRFVGLSEVSVAEVEAAQRVVPVVTVQNRFNLAEREAEPVLDHCESAGIGFIPWFPLLPGRLAKEGGTLARAAERLHATPAQVALAWLLRRSPVMLPIPGTSRVAPPGGERRRGRAQAGRRDVRAPHARDRRLNRAGSVRMRQRRWRIRASERALGTTTVQRRPIRSGAAGSRPWTSRAPCRRSRPA